MGHKVKVACVDLGGSTIPIDEMYVWVREIPKRERRKSFRFGHMSTAA